MLRARGPDAATFLQSQLTQDVLGLQRDQVSLLYIPPFFVHELHVWQGDALLFSMEGGISVSEDPNFRFDFLPNGAATFRVEAKDTDGKVYRREWPASATDM